MKKLLLLATGFFFVFSSFAQNVGIGTTIPTHTLHVLSTSGDPLRIEGLQGFSPSETSVLVIDPNTGVVRHMPLPMVGTDDQNLTLGIGTPTSTILNIDGGTGIIFQAGTNIQIMESGNTITISADPDQDSDPTNEIQTITEIGDVVTLSNGGGSFTDTDTQLSEADVDNYVNNNGYLLTEVDGSVTNELQTISETGNVVTLSNGGGTFIDTDTDTQLNEAQVDNFVSNNGYLTNVAAGDGLTTTGPATSPTFSVSANNGLNVNAVADELRLGGSLNQNTIITQGPYFMLTNLSGAGNFLIRDNNSPLFAAMNTRRVGIGTETPLYKFDVNGEIAGRAANAFRLRGTVRSVLLRNDNNNYWHLVTDSSDSTYNTLRPYRIQLTTGNIYMANNKVGFIHATGNVGIGTTAPSERLHVVGRGRISTLSGTGNRMVIANATGVLSTQAIPIGSQTISLSGSTATLSNNGGSISINDADSNPTNEIQTISETGNVVTLSNNGGSFTDDNTQLSETQVDNFVSNNGFLTGVTAGVGILPGGTATAPSVRAAANNGINVDAAADRIQLGGALVENTTITQGAFRITHNLTSTGDFVIRDNGLPLFIARDNGRIGIGTEAPTEELHVVGDGRISSLSGTGNRMVIADANGVLSAQAIPIGAQTISLSGSTATLSNGGGSVSINDADSNPTNEIQTISETGNVVTLSNGGGSFTDTDTNTQLSEAQVDNFVNNNGYLTSVVAGVGLVPGGTATAPSVSAAANNGINIDAAADRIQLGGPLTETTTLTHGAYTMIHDLTSTGDFLIRDAGSNRFSVLDNGRVTVGGIANSGAFNVTGTSFLSDDLYLRDGSVNGDNLVRIFDNLDRGVIDVYNAGLVTTRIHGFGSSYFTGGNVGIGTMTPAQKLHVVGTTRISTLAGTGNRMVIATGNGDLATQAIPIGDVTGVTAGSGLTGGGTTGTPTVSAAANNGINIDAAADRIQLGGVLVEATTITQGAQRMTYNLNGTGDFAIRDNNTPFFYAGDNGRVGIGTEAPLYKLDVVGEITSRNANAFKLRGPTKSVMLRNDNANFWALITDTPDGSYNALRPLRIELASGNLHFNSGKINFMNATGNVGIGTTAPSQKLHVVGTGRFSNLGGTGNRMVIADGNGVLATQAIPVADHDFYNVNTNQPPTNIAHNIYTYGSISYGALGVPNKATGAYSLAGGLNTSASGQSVVVFGNANNVSGNNSLSGGVQNAITGTNSAAFGGRNTIGGTNNVVTGLDNIVNGPSNVVSGHTNTLSASATANTVAGTLNTMNGLWSIVAGIGNEIYTTNPSGTGHGNLVVGLRNRLTDSDLNIVAGADNVINTGSDHCLVQGQNNIVTATNAVAVGYTNRVNHVNSWAIGGNNTVGATSSLANQFNAHFVSGYRLFTNQAFTTGARLNAGSNTWAAISDMRAKRDILPLEYGLDEILKIKAFNYYYKGGTVKSLGFMAQEIQKIIPEIVHIPEQEDDFWSIRYTELIPVLTKAIQEQQTEIQDQNTEIQSLKQVNNVLLEQMELLNKRLEKLEQLD